MVTPFPETCGSADEEPERRSQRSGQAGQVPVAAFSFNASPDPTPRNTLPGYSKVGHRPDFPPVGSCQGATGRDGRQCRPFSFWCGLIGPELYIRRT
jgi:hypothetical protein